MFRSNSIDDIIKHFEPEYESFAEKEIRELLAPAWESLKKKGLPITDIPPKVEIAPRSFVQRKDGSSEIRGSIHIEQSNGRALEADLNIRVDSSQLSEDVELSTNRVGHKEQPIVVSVKLTRKPEESDYADRYYSLKTLLSEADS